MGEIRGWAKFGGCTLYFNTTSFFQENIDWNYDLDPIVPPEVTITAIDKITVVSFIEIVTKIVKKTAVIHRFK